MKNMDDLKKYTAEMLTILEKKLTNNKIFLLM